MKWEEQESRSASKQLSWSHAARIALSIINSSACSSGAANFDADAPGSESTAEGVAAVPPSAADLAGARQVAGGAPLSAAGAGATARIAATGNAGANAPTAMGSSGVNASEPPSAAGSGGAVATTAGAGAEVVAGSGGTIGPAAGAPAAGAPATTPIECPDQVLPPGDSTTTLQIGGMARTFNLHVPQGYTGKSPVPLVLDFHGLGSSGSAQKSRSGYAALSDQEGFIVAWTNGLDNAWNIGPCCTQSRTIDDLELALAVVDDIKARACIDPKRVYADGYSMGGGMSYYLACNAADVFATVAPSAFDLLGEDEMPCKPARPISVISFRGTADPIVPYSGGASSPPNGLNVMIHFRGAEETFQHWSRLNACQGEPTSTSGGCQTYSECAQGSEVTLCTKQGGSHDPGDAKLGWEMMKRHPMP